MKFLKHGLSIDETRVSALIVGFIATLGFALWAFFHTGIIDGGMLNLLAYQIGAITGVNVVDKFTNKGVPVEVEQPTAQPVENTSNVGE